jgi:hypothetical protein
MGITKVTSVVQQPCFALLRRNDRWEQVKVVTCITESGGVVKNTIRCPDGAELVVSNHRLRFDGRIKRFVPHPAAQDISRSPVV